MCLRRWAPTRWQGSGITVQQSVPVSIATVASSTAFTCTPWGRHSCTRTHSTAQSGKTLGKPLSCQGAPAAPASARRAPQARACCCKETAAPSLAVRLCPAHLGHHSWQVQHVSAVEGVKVHWVEVLDPHLVAVTGGSCRTYTHIANWPTTPRASLVWLRWTAGDATTTRHARPCLRTRKQGAGMLG